MTKRHCLACGGELVMSFRPNESVPGSPSEGMLVRPNAKWRCSTCGSSYTAEELRADHRASSNVTEHT
jgi:uncharacterized protein with PIN domain